MQRFLEWGSEEIALPYISPHDSRVHRYFPDFYIKVQENTGKIKRYLIEVKPLKQTTKPKKPKRQTKGYIREAFEYARNQAKWKAAREYCKDLNGIYDTNRERVTSMSTFTDIKSKTN